MVHKLAKILSVIVLSFLLGFLVMMLMNELFGKIGLSGGDDSMKDVILYGNVLFGPLLYAIPFTIIGFKIYPEPKKTPKK